MKPQHQNPTLNMHINYTTTVNQSKWYSNSYDQPPTYIPNSKQFPSSYALNTRYGSHPSDIVVKKNMNPLLDRHGPTQTMKSHPYQTQLMESIPNAPHNIMVQSVLPDRTSQPIQKQHHSPTYNNHSKLPSIRELLNEIEVTIRKEEEIVNVANRTVNEETSVPLNELYIRKCQNERKNNISSTLLTTHHSISNSIRIPDNTNSSDSNTTNHDVAYKGISSFENKKICKQKSTRYLSESANLILKQWLYDNWHNPYPDQGDKQQLSKLANITVSQVNNYFINARRRICKKFKNPPSSIHVLP